MHLVYFFNVLNVILVRFYRNIVIKYNSQVVNISKACLCMESANNWCLCRVKSEMNEVFLPKSRGESFKFKRR